MDGVRYSRLCLTLSRPSQSALHLQLSTMTSSNLDSRLPEDGHHIEPITISQPAGVTKLFENDELVLIPTPTDDPDGKC